MDIRHTEMIDHYPAYANHWNGHAARVTPRAAVTGLGKAYNDTIRAVLIAVAPPMVIRVYDIGCGAGLTYPLVMELWPDAFYTGLDISQVLIDHCWETYPDGDWVLIERPYLPPGYADLIICHSVLTHVYPNDAALYLRLIRNHLGDSGRASVSIHTDCKEGWRGDIGRIDYEPAYFEQMLADAGLEITNRIDGKQLVYGLRKGRKS